jgi:uncharacterized delta-60 repeat protein
MKLSRLALALFVTPCFCAGAFAASGDLDPTFGSGGFRVVPFDVGGNKVDTPSAIRADAQGRLVVVGTASGGAEGDRFAMARLSFDGDIDMPFGPADNGKITLRLDNSLDTGGRAVAIGALGPCAVGYIDVATPGTTRVTHAQCVSEAGNLEGEFRGGVSEGSEYNAATTTLSSNNFELTPVAGSIGTGILRDFLVSSIRRDKNSPDGLMSLDGGFGTQGKTRIAFDLGGQTHVDAATDIERIAGGGFWVVGYAQFSGEDYDFAVARLGADGKIDPAFDSDGKNTYSFDGVGSNKDDRAVAAAIDPQGRLVVVGTTSRDSIGGDLDIALLRLMPDGTADQSFGPNGKRVHTFNTVLWGARDEVGGLVIDEQSRIYVAGTLFTGAPANPSDIAVMRIAVNGEVDTDFGTQGRAAHSFAQGMSKDRGVGIVMQDTGVVVLGEKQFNNTDTDFVLLRVDTIDIETELLSDSFEGAQ